MKSIKIIVLMAFLAAMFIAVSACHKKRGSKVVSGIEFLPVQQQCIYEVQCDTPYTFIDTCGKYSIGEVVE